MSNASDSDFITLGHIVARIRVMGLRLLIPPLIGAGLAVVLTVLSEPVYTARAEVLVEPIPVGPAEGIVSEAPLNMETQRNLVKSDVIVKKVGGRIDSASSARGLREKLSVETVPQTELLALSYTAEDPAMAEQTVTAFASEYVEFRSQQADDELRVIEASTHAKIELVENRLSEIEREIERSADRLRGQSSPVELLILKDLLRERRSRTDAALGLRQDLAGLEEAASSTIGGSVVDPAERPTQPSGPNLVPNIVLGLVLGTAVSLAWLIIAESIATSARRNPRDVGEPAKAVNANSSRVG